MTEKSERFLVEKHEQIDIISLNPEMNWEGVPKLSDTKDERAMELLTLVRELNPSLLLLDCQDTCPTSIGMWDLLEVFKHVRAKKGKMCVCAAEHVYELRILSSTLDQLIRVESTREEGIAYLSQ